MIFSCISSGFNLIKIKHELTKIQRKKVKFTNSFKYVEHKILCICGDVYKIYECKDFERIFEALSASKKKKIKKTMS